ncbi:hypothetical protein CRUP_009967, partial [Coryphaenoides rupestris]
MRNASGLTAADLAHAQGFRECTEVLFNAQNLQRNLAPSQGQPPGFCLKGSAQNGDNSHPTLQGRGFLNGVPNRKRSFGMEASQIKKPRTNGFGVPPGLLNGNRPLGGTGEAHMECMMEEAATSGFGVPPGLLNGNRPLGGTGEAHMECMMEEAATSVAGETHCEEDSSSKCPEPAQAPKRGCSTSSTREHLLPPPCLQGQRYQPQAVNWST